MRTVSQRYCLALFLSVCVSASLASNHLMFMSNLRVSTGEGGLCELCESLLRRHRGRDEGDLHIKPHLEAV